MSSAKSFAQRFRSTLEVLAGREPRRLPAAAVPQGFRRSAVLLPFWQQDGDVRVVMTERAAALRSHAGQVSFPGGHVDPGDVDDAAAALREANEEIGLDEGLVDFLVPLDEAWSGAGKIVVPFAAWLRTPPTFAANPEEVARVLVAEVEPLCDFDALEAIPVEVGGECFVNYAFAGDWGRIVGLSADLLLEALFRAHGRPNDRAEVRLDELLRYSALPAQARVRG